MLKIYHIGSHTSIPGWPAHGTIEGLLDAISRWELDRRLMQTDNDRLSDHPERKPFRGPALSCGGKQFDPAKGCAVYVDGPPIYPEHPKAVSYLGNFVGYSFAFYLHTDDADLIAQLDAAIQANIERHTHSTIPSRAFS